MAYQAPLNGGRINASIGGNSTSAGGGYQLISTGTLHLAGGNNVTLSQNANTISINAGGGGTMSMYALGNTTQNSSATMDVRSVSLNGIGGLTAGYSNGSVQLSAPVVSSLSATGAVSISNNGGTISIGAPTQTNQTANFYVSGNSTQLSSTASIDLRSVTFQGGGDISVGVSQGKVLISGTQTNQDMSLYALGNTTQNSSTVLNASKLSFNGLGAATMGYSNGSIQVSVPTQTAENQSIGIGGTAGGSSATAGSVSVTGAQLRYNFYAGSNITLSQSANGASGSLSIYGGAGAGGGTLSLYGLGNTTQNSSTSLDVRSVSLNGLGAMTVGYSNGSVQLSAPVVSSVSATGALSVSVNGSTVSMGVPAVSMGISNIGNTSGTSGTASNQIVFAGGNNVTLSQSTGAGGNTITVSAASQTVQTQNLHNLTLAGNSTSAGAGYVQVSSGTLTLAGGNNITLSQNGNAVTVSAFNQTNQSLGLYGVGNTTGQSSSSTFDARTLSFQGAGAASVGYSNGSVVISAPNAAAGNVTFSAGGNSAGLASIVFSNSNGVSFGLNGSTITASAVGGAGGGVALYDGANSISSGTASVSAGGALTASINGQTLSLNAPATSSLVASGGLNLSSNGSTITLSVPGLMSNWMHNSAAMYSSSTASAGIGNASVSFVRMMIPQHISFTRIDIPVSVSVTTAGNANTAAMAISSVGVIYSRNGSTLNPIVGQSTNTTYSYNSNNTGSVTGPRMISLGLATTLSAGEYYLGLQMSSATTSVGTATTNLGWTVAPVFGTSYSVAPWQELGVGSNASINLYQPLQGMATVSISNTTQTFQQSQITQSGGTSVSNAMRANLIVGFRNN